MQIKFCTISKDISLTTLVCRHKESVEISKKSEFILSHYLVIENKFFYVLIDVLHVKLISNN